MVARGAEESRAQPERDAVGGRGEGRLQGDRPGRARQDVGDRQKQPRHGLREVQVGELDRIKESLCHWIFPREMSKLFKISRV